MKLDSLMKTEELLKGIPESFVCYKAGEVFTYNIVVSLNDKVYSLRDAGNIQLDAILRDIVLEKRQTIKERNEREIQFENKMCDLNKLEEVVKGKLIEYINTYASINIEEKDAEKEVKNG